MKSKPNEREAFNEFFKTVFNTSNPDIITAGWLAWQHQQKRIDDAHSNAMVMMRRAEHLSDVVKSLQAQLTIAVNEIEYLAQADFDSEDAPQDAEAQVGWVIDIVNGRATEALAEIKKIGE
jgi:hypothetical protein